MIIIRNARHRLIGYTDRAQLYRHDGTVTTTLDDGRTITAPLIRIDDEADDLTVTTLTYQTERTLILDTDEHPID